MPVQTVRIPATQALVVKREVTGKLGVAFLNLNVRSGHAGAARHGEPEALQGCGLYALCFEGELLYVGKYLGSRQPEQRRLASFTGNVAAQRWWAHVASFTARGHRLHVSRTALQSLDQSRGADHPLARGLRAAGASLHADSGCLGSAARLAFAAAHWENFSTRDARNLLDGFEFVYTRVRPGAADPADVASAISRSERALIQTLRPPGNASYNKHATAATVLTPDQTAQALQRALEVELSHA